MRRVILSIITCLLLTLLLVGNAFANPYLGGYPNTSIYYKVDKVWMKTKFVVEENLLNCNINSVLSTAGSTGSVVTGWVYQGGVWMEQILHVILDIIME